MADEVNLFADDGTAPLIPDTNTANCDDTKHLISEGLSKAIGGEVVKSLMIPENLEIYTPNYVLDFREAKILRKHQISILTTLVRDDGDTHIYVCLANGMEKIGMGVGSILDSILQPGLESIFGKACKLYKDVEIGKPVYEVTSSDHSTIRLDL